jgi:hypothetical protein
MSLVAVPDRVSMVPSPQSTLNETTVPSGSVAEIVRVTFWLVVSEVDDGLKLGTGILSLIVTCEDVEVYDALLSVAVTIIVNICDVEEPVEV